MVTLKILSTEPRLFSVKWAKGHAISDILSVDSFDENHLYQALEWLE